MKQRNNVSGLVRVQKTLNTPRTIIEIKFRRMPSESETRNYRKPENKVKPTAVAYFKFLS
jgi:hypothetical protein